LDAKAVWRDAVTLDMTLNPDFSQVESDEPQVTINQRYEVFYPEKRPFFIENAGMFQTPINLFFSRRIVDPQYGGRLTGKVGRWAIGAVGSNDLAPGRLCRRMTRCITAGRAMACFGQLREFGNESNIGLLVTSHDFASSFNRVFSLDTRLKLSSNWLLSAQAGRSITQELEGASSRAQLISWSWHTIAGISSTLGATWISAQTFAQSLGSSNASISARPNNALNTVGGLKTTRW
jgi:hypothetical protein